MKTKVLDNIISNDELFFMYNQITSTNAWNITGKSSDHEEESWDKKFTSGPNMSVKYNETISHYPFYLWGKTVVYRIKEKLNRDNIGLNTNIARMWFNITYNDNINNWLHKDAEQDSNVTSVVLFLTPVWNPEWRGSFYVDGEKFNFKSGSGVIFNSNEYHTAEAPDKNTFGWMRLSCNMLLIK